jgi:hypothetical protein
VTSLNGYTYHGFLLYNDATIPVVRQSCLCQAASALVNFSSQLEVAFGNYQFQKIILKKRLTSSPSMGNKVCTVVKHYGAKFVLEDFWNIFDQIIGQFIHENIS